MTTFQIPVQVNKKNIGLVPSKMAFYRQAKIIEATDDDLRYYYLFFYKNNFLTGVQANHLKINSYIHQAFTKGIVLKGSHPIIHAVIQQQKNITITTLKQLFNKVKQKNSPIETINIFTTFDSFIAPDTLHNLLKDFYYTHRRNGQNLAASQLLAMYLQYDQTDVFANDMLHEMMQFQSRKTASKDTIYENDPINAEIYYFDHLFQKNYSNPLIQLYNKQNRWIDELILRFHLHKKQFTEENLSRIQELIKQFNKADQYHTLESLEAEQSNQFIQEMMIDYLLTAQDHNETVRFFMKRDYQPQADQLQKLILSVENADQSVLLPLFDKSNTRIIQLFHNEPKIMNNICTRFVSSYLNTYSLEKIISWFKPFHKAQIHLPIEQKINHLKALENDPDQQLLLGKLYVEFQQTDKAIDCFKWEMELNPENPEPIKWLSKVYKQAGNKTEADTYQQLWIQMEKSNVS